MIEGPKGSEQHFLEGKVSRRYFINAAIYQSLIHIIEHVFTRGNLDKYHKATAILHVIYCTIENERKLKV